MWCRLKNLLLSVKTYDDLSPDLTIRRQVQRGLSDRPALTSEQWFQAHGQAIGVSSAVISFAYRALEQYTGLPFAKILPHDRLEADLRWTEVCWFDWQNRLCEDFCQNFAIHFAIHLDEQLEEFDPVTIADLLVFLDRSSSRHRFPKDAGVEEVSL